MRLFHRICRGKVIVFARIDTTPAKPLIILEKYWSRAFLYIDVAEQDSVQRIVKHHIQAFKSAHHGNLRHTKAGTIVAQPDVPSHLIPGFARACLIILKFSWVAYVPPKPSVVAPYGRNHSD